MPEESLPFESFLGGLIDCHAAGRHALTGARPDVRYCETGLPEFVGPSLRTRSDIENAALPNVIIVSASGAVGKSTLAAELARRKRSPLWDLSRAKTVGQGSLEGMISQAFGRGAASAAVYSDLQQGAIFFVVDALDEARVKVTETAFEDFLRDVSALAGDGPGVKAVLLGRTQVAETAWLLLEDMGTRTAFYTIEPFEEEQARLYIEKRLDRLGGPAAAAMRANVGPFEEVRDLLFTKLADSVRGSRTPADAARDIRSFLGYAPVLDAMALRLASQPNWAVQKQEIAAAMAPNGQAKRAPAAILRQVIEAILEREQEQKLVQNLRPVLEPVARDVGWAQWDALYSREEQCSRVLARHLDFRSHAEAVLRLPPELGAQYEEQLAAWLPEHPFLRDGKSIANVVFESFLFARALCENGSTARAAVEARLREPSYLPTRLLSEFYLLFKAGEAQPEVPAEHVGWLYDSVLSEEGPGLRIDFALDGPDPTERDEDEPEEPISEVDGEFVFTRDNEPDDSARRIEFQTRVSATSVIRFGRYIKHASITVPCEVALGTGGDEYEIGPRVDIRSRRLLISARAVVIGGKSRHGDAEAGAVSLEARACEASVTSKPTVHTALRVNWPGSSAFPWTESSQESAEAYPPGSDLAPAYWRFRRIVMTLRSHSRGSLARYKGKVEHRRVLKGALGEKLLERLVADGVLRLEGRFYHWVPETAAAKVGTSWQQLRRGETSPKLTEYLHAFLRVV